jgi:hypothetical protein
VDRRVEVEARPPSDLPLGLPAEGYPEPPNDWQRYSSYNITIEKSARNQSARLRKSDPWKTWRVRPVAWETVPIDLSPQ